MNTTGTRAAPWRDAPVTAPATAPARTPWAAALACVLTMLSACGGGSGPDQVAGVSSGGTGSVGVGGAKPTAVVGTVTSAPASAQGLVVNDVKLDVDSGTTVVDADNQPLSSTDLQPGMTVTVDGDTTQARSDGMHSKALRVQVRGLLRGLVQSVNATQRSLRLMDHTVVLDASASIDAHWAQGLSGIQAGDLVEVYGWQDVANQRYVATRLAYRTLTASTTFKVTGQLADLTLTPGDEHCAVGTQAIAYSWPNAPQTLANGQWVRGDIYNPRLDVQGRWGALGMTPVAPWLQDKTQISLDGLITQTSQGGLQLSVQGWPVRLQAGTCSICASLKTGDHIRVLGSLVQGTVEASAITTLP
jgi:hypothetical protein